MPGPAEMKVGALLTANTNKRGQKSKARNTTNPNIDQHLSLQMTVYFPLLLRLLRARQIQVLTILPTEKLREREDRKGIKGEKKERTKDETSRKRKRRKKEGNNQMVSPLQGPMNFLFKEFIL